MPYVSLLMIVCDSTRAGDEPNDFVFVSDHTITWSENPSASPVSSAALDERKYCVPLFVVTN